MSESSLSHTMICVVGTPAARNPSQIACTMARCVERSGPPMVVILMPTTSRGVMPSRVQAVPRSEALVSFKIERLSMSRAAAPLTLKRWTISGFSVQMTGESVRGGDGGAGAAVTGGGG